ncbi:MAG: flagellar motor switch protein FliM [Oscillospiraceae bacterium]|nr:flagellar motor switch protein FliM [Oscillospiraceae bacterium]
MAEKLSQSQIDALLNAVRSGEKDLNSPAEQTPEQKYKKYDFNSPRKFTKDRIKMLSGIYENYSRIINSRLNGRLRTNCEISVESVEEQHYYEFANALTEGDVLAIMDVYVKDKLHEIPAMVYIGTTTALSMMDRLMGGEGTVDSYSHKSDYNYTDLELKLYEDIVEDLISVMGSSWENYMPVRFTYSHTDVNPTMSQIVGLDETVVIIDMKLKLANVEGRMSICLPGEILMTIFTEMNRNNPTRRAAAENKADEIFDQLRDSSLEVVAQLGGTTLTLSDVYHLNVGDVIDIGKSKDAPIHLEIGGYRWFSGRIGVHKKNLAVKIDAIYDQAE